MTLEKRTFRAEVRAVGNTIAGLIPYSSPSSDMGGWREILVPGVFRDSLMAKEPIMSLWNHDAGQPLGSTVNGSLKIEDTKTALKFTIKPAKTSYSGDVLNLIREGVITGTSFGFHVERDTYDEERNIRYVKRAKLIEISPVSFPAYPETSVTVRNRRRNTTMKKDIKELREERAKITHDQRELLNSGLDNDEKRARYERMDNDFFEITSEIELREREESLSRSIGTVAGRPDPSQPGRSEPRKINEDVTVWLPGSYRAPELTDMERRSLSAKFGYEHRDSPLQSDSDSAGGYTVESEKLSSLIIAEKQNMVFVRKYSTVVTLREAMSLGVPALANEPDEASWTSELLVGGTDSSMAFDGRSLTPHPLAKSLKISKTLRRRNPRIVDFIKDRLAYRLSTPEENAFLNGSGVNSPLGIFTSSDHGINSSRDVSTGNTTTAITADGLINCKYSLKAQYRSSSSIRWAFHRDAVKMVRKLKDGESNYLWTLGLSGKEDTILGIPYDESEYVPSTFTTGLLVGALIDWSTYWIADALNMQFQIAVERYIEQNQDLIVIRSEVDGMPTDYNAAARIKLA